MIDDWFSAIELPLNMRQFRQLPQNPAYKYEYFDGHAWLSPRPKSCHAILDLQSLTPPADGISDRNKVVIRSLQEDDWSRLPSLFAAAFHRVQPFASLTDKTRLKAAEDCLGQTREGAEGPLVNEACLVAAEDDAPVGATLVTLPPRLAIACAEGLPHLTWIFVGPFQARQGIGTALLGAAARALLRLGFARLASTFLVGNESSMLWHWQAGFTLLEQPWSVRRMRKETADGD